MIDKVSCETMSALAHVRCLYGRVLTVNTNEGRLLQFSQSIHDGIACQQGEQAASLALPEVVVHEPD